MFSERGQFRQGNSWGKLGEGKAKKEIWSGGVEDLVHTKVFNLRKRHGMEKKASKKFERKGGTWF